MSNQWVTLLVVVLLMFWAVGARNRLVSMRNDISRCFTLVQAQIQQRHQLLAQWTDSLRVALGEAAPELASVQAACQQVQVACEHLQLKPAGAQPATSLRMAEETLAAARQRVPVPAALAGPQEMLMNEPPGLALSDSLAAADNTLAFARHQFNNATQAYNDALMQFPTWVIAGLFGFRAAGTL